MSTTNDVNLMEVVDEHYSLSKSKNDGKFEVFDKSTGIVVHRANTTKQAAKWAVLQLVKRDVLSVSEGV